MLAENAPLDVRLPVQDGRAPGPCIWAPPAASKKSPVMVDDEFSVGAHELAFLFFQGLPSTVAQRSSTTMRSGNGPA